MDQGPRYKVEVYNAAGALVALIGDALSISVAKVVNEPGLLRLELPGESDKIALFEHNGEVVVSRLHPLLGIETWVEEFRGLFNYWEAGYTDRHTWECRCPGLLQMLSWRVVAYRAGMSNKSKFTGAKAETIMKTLVTYNATASATTGNNRLRDGAITGVSVQADGAAGETIDEWLCSGEGLLATLQRLAPTAGGDFDLVHTGAAAWQFRWYTGQRGTDRSASLLFALARGNMANPKLVYDRTQERTVAIVGGPGEETTRVFTIVTGPDYAAGNDIELWVNGQNEKSTAARTTLANQQLDAAKARYELTFDVTQVASCAYGNHYTLGDLVTANFGGVSQTLKITAVTLTYQQRTEDVGIKMGTV